MALELDDDKLRCKKCNNPLLLVVYEFVDLKTHWDDFQRRRPRSNKVEFAREVDNTVPSDREAYLNHPTYILVLGLLQGPGRRRYWRRQNVIAKCPICGATKRLASLEIPST